MRALQKARKQGRCDIFGRLPTYGKHVAVELTEDNPVQFFIPKGFAHGFAVLSETAVFQYKCDNFYHPEADGGISILDDTLGIDWKIPTEHANLSEKDTKHAMLKDFDSPFDVNVDLYKQYLMADKKITANALDAPRRVSRHLR